MAVKTVFQLEPVNITFTQIEDIANLLLEKYDESERNAILRFFIKVEVTKKIQEFLRKENNIETSLEQFAKQMEIS